ncbi:sulfate transporter [Schizosaccharomyces japonicus yFS275]|uniref:Sulfate transporter n=1 Tax=Schizosaccharomyces japonicus (strain yFS275 / FY16936) TaxID=402676 RepID=B6K2J2_SCHJY|nr:sulfate transporter [Schizosaccharomyces japonicus yFS275]EEB07373.1 sulfate transporter [Schizosaccharomyces japonicus yFS275]
MRFNSSFLSGKGWRNKSSKPDEEFGADKSTSDYNASNDAAPTISKSDLTKSGKSSNADIHTSTHPVVEEVSGEVEYVDELPTMKDWVREHVTHDFKHRFVSYLRSLFPIINWLPNYNVDWLVGDMIAGLTVGTVIVPQSMSYANVAGLPAEYGLYSSFVGVAMYSFFATSKDVSIGPVAVMSLVTSKVITAVQSKDPNHTAPEIATALAMLTGAITFIIGLLRLGFIIEFIPVPAVSGFTTGSALNIISGQIPALMGYKKRVHTQDATYKVVINTFKNLPHTKLDAAFGLVSLFVLYAIRFLCQKLGARYPRYSRYTFLIHVLRSGMVIIVGTLISYGICRNRMDNPPISVLGTVPRGFQHIGVPKVSSKLVSDLAGELPVSVIVLLLEHISIAKSFGRVNDYKIIPDQELIAIGATNLVGMFFNAYPATGSFSRSAIKAKSGVRTPLAGIWTAGVVIMALYCLTGAFKFIPNAILSAVIIHAVGDLIAKWSQMKQFWRVQPLEAMIFFAAVLVSVFSSIENGIYAAVCLSAALLLFRIAKPAGSFLGQLRIANKYVDDNAVELVREVFVPLDQKGLNPNVTVEAPPRGLLIFRLQESFTYPNAGHVNDMLVSKAKEVTRRLNNHRYARKGDRPWNDYEKASKKIDPALDTRPILKAVILDFSAVNHIDTTGVQALVDTRKELEIYAGGEVEFHFTDISNPWIKRSLVAVGFGKAQDDTLLKSRAIEVGSAAPLRDLEDLPSDVLHMPYRSTYRPGGFDEEEEIDTPASDGDSEYDITTTYSKKAPGGVMETHYYPVISTEYPFFHVDVTSAVIDCLHRGIVASNYTSQEEQTN